MIFDINPDKVFDSKYTIGKSQKWINWMIEHSHPKTYTEFNTTIVKYCEKYGWNSDLNWIDVSDLSCDLQFQFSNPY